LDGVKYRVCGFDRERADVQFGISTHLFHSQPLAERHLREVADHGFDCVELFATHGHFEYRDAAAIAHLGGWLQATGVRLHSVHAPIVESLAGTKWGAPYSIATSDQSARQKAVQETIAAVGIARTVPYDYLVVHLGVPTSQNPAPNDNNREQARRSIEQIHEAAHPLGVRLALEVVPNALSTPDSLVQMIEDELDLPGIGICLDFGHAAIMGNVLDAIETVSGHLITTHVHDNRGRTDDHLGPFEGTIDWLAALTDVQKVGYEGTLLFELQSSEPSLKVLERAVAARGRFERILDPEWGREITGA
jgi:sugar phosphate isomerase/epimerase